jgi:serine/threonine-protein kinase RsbW/stage II sporulation protein AB (anti-sigma F factor)
VFVALSPPHRVELRLSATAANVPVARRAIIDLCSALGLSERLSIDVQIAVTEACANAVIHAYVDREVGEFELEASRRGERLFVSVRDQGRGLVPRTDSPGGGLGFALMASLASTLELHGVPGESNTAVSMQFDCATAA